MYVLSLLIVILISDINYVNNHNDDGKDLIIFPGVPRRASEHEDLDLAGRKRQQFYPSS